MPPWKHRYAVYASVRENVEGLFSLSGESDGVHLIQSGFILFPHR